MNQSHTSDDAESGILLLQSTGLTFDVAPPKGQQSFTPNTLLLANSETRMNMLSPNGGQDLYHTDIETGK